jgi:hypothetical protein
MMESAALSALAMLVLIGAAYGYYWYSPAPPLPPLSAWMRSTSLFCWICYFGGVRATAWQRAGPEDVSPAAQPSPSLLIGGTRAPFFRTTRLPSADELFVGMFSVTRDIDLPIA